MCDICVVMEDLVERVEEGVLQIYGASFGSICFLTPFIIRNMTRSANKPI